MNSKSSLATTVYRVAKGNPWTIREPSGKNRFDIANPTDPIFTLYVGESEEAALAEVLASQRPSLVDIAEIESIPCDDLENEPLFKYLSLDWISTRKISSAHIRSTASIADITLPSEIAHLRNIPSLAKRALECGYSDIDESSLKAGDEKNRLFTQSVAAYYFNNQFDGIRYGSRLGAIYYCIAGFIPVSIQSIEESPIISNVIQATQLTVSHPALIKVTQMYGLLM